MNSVALCLGGYVGGLVLAQYLTLPLFPALVCLCLLFVLLLLNRKPSVFPFTLLLFCALTALLRYPAQLSPSATSQLDALLENGVMRIEGRVLATHQRPDDSLVIDLVLLAVGSSPTGLQGEDRLRLYLGTTEEVPTVGTRVVFSSRIRRTRNFGIPGEFDYARHLAYRRIWYTAYMRDSRGLAIYAEPSVGFSTQIDQIRQTGMKMLDEALARNDAILLKGLLLGEKGAMPSVLRQKLAAGGISHLFAISGLHLGLLALLMYAVLKFIYSRSARLLLWQPPFRVLWLLILPMLFFYLLLTGDALATRRAFYALLITIALCLVRRRIDSLNLLYALAFLFLIFEPLALWQPSFLLSFSGVLGILLWQKPLCELLKDCSRLCQYPLQLFGVSLAAFIATLPAVIFIFHMFAPAGLICNLIAIPLVSFGALPMGLAGLLVSAVSPAVGEILLRASAWVLQQVVDLAGFVSELPGLFSRSLYLTLPETLAVLLTCLSLLVVWRRRRALFLLFPAACLLLIGPGVGMSPEIILFSVGQGESILLRAEGKNLLIDGGGLRSASFDVGERLLAPALGRLGIKSLDAVILTHDHPDHSGGLGYIIEHFDVGEFWSTSDLVDLSSELGHLLLKNDVVIQKYDKVGWRKFSPGGLQSVSLFTASIEESAKNDRSLCLYYPTEAGGILLTGDLERRGVQALLEKPLPGAVGLLKAPHHGSRSSKPKRMLGQLKPEVVIVSAGYENSYHFPAQELLEQAQRLGIKVWRTDLDGTVRLRVAGRNWQVDQWRKGLFR